MLSLMYLPGRMAVTETAIRVQWLFIENVIQFEDVSEIDAFSSLSHECIRVALKDGRTVVIPIRERWSAFIGNPKDESMEVRDALIEKWRAYGSGPNEV